VGKPRTRWEDVIRRDKLQILGREETSIRQEWRGLLREAKAQKGL